MLIGTTRVLTALLGAVAAVSLLVGGIGISIRSTPCGTNDVKE